MCWGCEGTYDYGQCAVPVAALSAQAAVSAGGYHTCSVSTAGALQCWGAVGHDYGQTSIPAFASSNQAAVAAGVSHTCALSIGGTVACWGCADDPTMGQCTVPASAASNQVAVSTTYGHTCSLSMSGAIACWGANSSMQLAVPAAALSGGQVAVSTGMHHSCSLSSAGLVRCWGAGTFVSTLDGLNLGQAVPPPNLPPQMAISNGGWHSCALSTAGAVRCWGADWGGQSAVPAAATSNQVAVAAGDWHTCSLSSAGGATCFGYNAGGPATVPAFAQSGVTLPCLPVFVPSSTPSRSSSPAPSPTATSTPPLCRAPVSRITLLSGLNGTSLPARAATAGNAGMYTSGSCSSGFGTFFSGAPRLVYYLNLGGSVPLGGILTLTTCGQTSDDTVLYVGTGCPTWAVPFNCLRGNDNAGDVAGQAPCASNAAAATVSLTTTSRVYFVQIGGFSGTAVTSGLSWSYRVASASPSRTRSASSARTPAVTATKSRSRKAA